jgi:hypothetical protein
VKIPKPPPLLVLAVASLGAVGAGAWLLLGVGPALLVVGGLVWLDLFVAGTRKGAKP